MTASELRHNAFGKAVCGLLPLLLTLLPTGGLAVASASVPSTESLRLPSEFPPEVACWFWGEADFAPEGYKEKIDLFGQSTSFTLLTASFRAGRREPLTDPAVFTQVKAAVQYARTKGIGVAPEFSMWSDITGFLRSYPDELCWVVSLQILPRAEAGTSHASIAPVAFNGCPSLNYEPGGRPEVQLPPARLLRAYSCDLVEGVIKAGSLVEVTHLCHQAPAPDGTLNGSVDWKLANTGNVVAVLGASPSPLAELFAPHYNEYQGRILRHYAMVGLAGACKDENGDPAVGLARLPWLTYRQEAYRRATSGRDLLADFLLMRVGEQGREAERQLAINYYLELVRRQNAAVECAFYDLVKECLGPEAFVGTHPTWISDPDNQGEYQRNGLDWWAVKRDIAQTDEECPFWVGTALSKKWRSPFWLNMYDSPDIEAYRPHLWKYAVSGGRMNFHPMWPVGGLIAGEYSLHRTALMRGQQRIRLLNLISQSPLDCPVAIVFGHAAAMNYAGPHFQDSGSALAGAFWAAGYPADLIPSSEIESQSLKVDADGAVSYGPQHYAAVILYHPEFEKTASAGFWQQAAKGKSALFRIGDWTRDFDAKPVRGDSLLPPAMKRLDDAGKCVEAVVQSLKAQGMESQQAGQLNGNCRLLDGTRIFVAAEKRMSGDPLRKSLRIGGTTVSFDAEGLAAVRLAADGRPDALAGGGVRSFTVGDWTIELDTRADLALWHDSSGHWQGALQGWDGAMPPGLSHLTTNWLRLAAHRLAQRTNAATVDPKTLRLPAHVPPVVGAWFPQAAEIANPEGYKEFIDAAAEHAHYNLVTTTMRDGSRQMVEPAVHDWFKAAAQYAQTRSLGLVLELDPRHSLAAFKKRYPEALQERLWLQEFALAATGQITAEVNYTLGHGDAICGAEPNAIRLERVYSYVKTPQGIEPDSVKDITALCTVQNAAVRDLAVGIPCGAGDQVRKACVVACVTFDFPAVFAPQTLRFEAETIRQYADVPLTGLMKDEWGFPAVFDGNPNKNGYWYSTFQAAAYARATGGRNLVRDSILMWQGERGRQPERQAAINQVMELYRVGTTAIEQAFYHAAKTTFGPQAFVGTHPTTFPVTDAREFERCGLNWWTATRDFAQSDETTPYYCRVSLAKKFGGPVWYNQWYASTPDSYGKLIWSYALAGGRMNFHILFPRPGTYCEGARALMRSPVLNADARIRLLNLISQAPLDCPVAVIFGHACAMNWAGPGYNDTGTELADAFWRAGWYADLIPSTELREQALRVDEAGNIWFGKQRYAAVVLYHPEFENAATAAFFRKAARGKTILGRLGDWTRDFAAEPFAGNAALPPRMKSFQDIASCVQEIVADLRRLGVEPQTPATVTFPKWGGMGPTSAALPSAGMSRLTDGTVILVAGEHEVTGDPIQKTIKIGGREVSFDALGVAAVRLGKAGAVEAMMAGGLRSFRSDHFSIELLTRTDMALWHDTNGNWQGALQDCEGEAPAPLLNFTARWLRLRSPQPLEATE